MKIILQKSVERLGDPGDVADVADGYARNYLIPRGLAVKAEKGTVRHAESLKRAHEVRTSAQDEIRVVIGRVEQASSSDREDPRKQEPDSEHAGDLLRILRSPVYRGAPRHP